MKIRCWIIVAISALLAMSGQAQAESFALGTSSGLFEKPRGERRLTVSGVGTDYFTWGQLIAGSPGINTLRFKGSGFSATPEEPFTLGELTYYNGTTRRGSNAKFVELKVLLDLNNGSQTSFSIPVTLISTPNNASHFENADIVKLGALPEGTLLSIGDHVYRLTLSFAKTSKVKLEYSTLELGEDGSDSYIRGDQFHVFEGFPSTASIQGTLTPYTPPKPSRKVVSAPPTKAHTSSTPLPALPEKPQRVTKPSIPPTPSLSFSHHKAPSQAKDEGKKHSHELKPLNEKLDAHSDHDASHHKPASHTLSLPKKKAETLAIQPKKPPPLPTQAATPKPKTGKLAALNKPLPPVNTFHPTTQNKPPLAKATPPKAAFPTKPKPVAHAFTSSQKQTSYLDPSAFRAFRAIGFSFDTELGRIYQIQTSSDRRHWENSGEPIIGNGESFKIFKEIESSTLKHYRVEVTQGSH